MTLRTDLDLADDLVLVTNRKILSQGIPMSNIKDMAHVKVFPDKQTDRQTNGQAKNSIPLIYRRDGMKKK